ncbi:MAG: hypothetical protein V9E92_09945 [Methylotenera sp.]
MLLRSPKHGFENKQGLENSADKLLHTGFSTLYGTELRVLLQPNEIVLNLLKRDFMDGFRAKVVHSQTVTLADVPKSNDQQAIAPQLLNKLIEALQKPVWKGAAPVVVLSNYFMRYLVLDWNEDIKSKQERSAYLKHSFLQHFGETSKDWHLREYLATYGKSAIASGVSQTLLRELEAAFYAANLKAKAIHPMLMLVANHALHYLKNHKLAANFWLACVENNRLTLALIDEGSWKFVCNLAAEHEVGKQIGTLIQRESIFDQTFPTFPIMTIGCGDVLINDSHIIKLEDENQGIENQAREFAYTIQPKWAA